MAKGFVSNIRRATVVTVFIAALLFGAACGGAAGARDGKPERIVSLSPNTTEILHGVGAFDRVVAVSDYCTYPPEAARLPKVGGWNNPNLEQIAALRPDLVVFAEAQSQFVKDKVEALGVRAVSVPSQSLEDVYRAIAEVGRAAGEDEAAARLLEETRGAVEDVRRRTANLPRRRVLCVVDRVPGTLRDIYTAAGGSFIAQLVEAAGGEVIAPPAQSGWGKLQKEAVIALDPEVIIDMVQSAEGSLAEDPLAVWRELPTLKAVREGRVHPVRDVTLIHPSQFVGTSARRFAEMIHPEVFRAER
ncbi:MAG TPA: ABC transporter substrate-binding protein [Pyrinomonadaceae bacterium]|nr:ABC transporter substrate-binding protein [Pyrinomonadaceae bacterium]